ncbi:MAG: protein BatD [Candidatus Neomarinimicrobiota bacterium]|nr:MAG: protein BatD [Candidatus Neomarinimicrobiota bacterium]
MRFRRVLSGILLSWLLGPVVVHGQTVTATVSTNRVSQGEVFSLTIQAENADADPVVDLQPLARNFTVVSGPSSSTNISWINGKMNQTKSVTYSLTANRTGTLSIPALSVRVGKKTFRTTPIGMHVTTGPKKGKKSSPDVFLDADIDKTTAVVGEQITVTYKLYTRVNLQIEQLQYPDYVGFWTEDLFVPKTADFRDAAIQGVAYKVATLYTVALFPTKTGTIQLPPMTVRCSVPVKSRRRRNSFFDDPFFDSFDPFGRQQRTRKILRTDPATIQVNPYPSHQPDGFTGAVGSFRVQTTLDTTTVQVNEGVTFRVLLSGTGNLPLISTPEITFPRGIEVYPPSSEVKRDPFRDRISGTIRWDYILIPREAGTFQLPQVRIPYFDLDHRRWATAGSRSLALAVLPGPETPALSGDYTKREVALLSKDIRYMHTRMPAWIHQDRSRFPRKAAALYVLSLALWLLPAVVRQSRQAREATEKERRARTALKRARRDLQRISGSPFEAIPPIVYRYIRDRFQYHTEILDAQGVKAIFRERGLDGDAVEGIVDVLHQCDAGKYAPGATAAETALVRKTLDLLEIIDAF